MNEMQLSLISDGTPEQAQAILDLSTQLNMRIFESKTKKEVMVALNEFFEEVRKYGVQYYTTEN